MTRPRSPVPLAAMLVAVMAAAVALSACGGDDAKPSITVGPVSTTGAVASNTPVANAGPTDVCGLVTFKEVSAALGATAADRAATVPPVKQEVATGLTADVSACEYSAASTGGFVKLDLWEAKSEPAKVKQVTQFVCSDKEEIPGLGDFACWYNTGHREIKLAKGGGYLDIKSGTLTNDALQSLAEKAVARLP